MSVRQQNIADLRPLKELSKLVFIDLEENNITDAEPLQNLKKLKWVSLKHNKITNLTGLTSIIEKGGYLCISENNLDIKGNPQIVKEIQHMMSRGIKVDYEDDTGPDAERANFLPESWGFIY